MRHYCLAFWSTLANQTPQILDTNSPAESLLPLKLQSQGSILYTALNILIFKALTAPTTEL